MSWPEFMQHAWRRQPLLRYLVVGVANTGFAYAVYAASLALGCSYPLASLISLVAGICLSFKTQGRFVFRDTRNSLFGRFVASWAMVYAFNVGVISVFVRLGIEPWLAGALALPFNVAAGYALQRWFVFGGKAPPRPADHVDDGRAAATAGLTLDRRAWPAALLVAAQVLIYAVMSGRGFEYTDEAFYLLNALHWREFSATFTLFGAFVEAPLHLLGDSLTAVRFLTLAGLLGAGALLGLEVRRQQPGDDSPQALPAAVYALLGAAGSLYYFGVFQTLRVPSYNLISLCTSMVSTALLIRSLSERRLRAAWLAAAGYGFVIAACGLSKASTGLLLVGLHVAFLLAVNRDWSWRGLGGRVLAATLGLGVQVAIVTYLHPGWPGALQAGATLFSYDTGGKLGGMINEFRWDLQRLGPWMMVAAVALGAWAWLVRASRHRLSWLPPVVGLAFVGLIGVWTQRELSLRWWPWTLVVVLALGIVQRLASGPSPVSPGTRRTWPLWVMLFLLPFVFSFGTSNSVLWHSQAAAGFVVLALVMRLDGLARQRLLPPVAVALALACLCAVPLWFQWRPVIDGEGTYRLAVPLREHIYPIQTPVGLVQVDERTRADITALQSSAHSAGLEPGMPILDFTGDGPGRVLAVGARPLGVPWLVGGYPDSPRWAERLLGLLPSPALREAWIFSSPDGPRTIAGWEPALAAKVGGASHELAAVIHLARSAGFSGKADEPITLCLWRPRHPPARPEVPPLDSSVCSGKQSPQTR